MDEWTDRQMIIRRYADRDDRLFLDRWMDRWINRWQMTETEMINYTQLAA